MDSGVALGQNSGLDSGMVSVVDLGGLDSRGGLGKGLGVGLRVDSGVQTGYRWVQIASR